MAKLRVLSGDFSSSRSGTYFVGDFTLFREEGQSLVKCSYKLAEDVKRLRKLDHKVLSSLGLATAAGAFRVATLGILPGQWSFGRVTFEVLFADGRKLIAATDGRSWLSMKERFGAR